MLYACPLMTPAPHYHTYSPINNSEINEVEVFCTPRVKVYHMFYHKDSKIEVCSKVFEDQSCTTIEKDTFFDKVKYTKTIRINDGRFHRLFVNDTLSIRINDSSKIHLFIPVD